MQWNVQCGDSWKSNFFVKLICPKVLGVQPKFQRLSNHTQIYYLMHQFPNWSKIHKTPTKNVSEILKNPLFIEHT